VLSCRGAEEAVTALEANLEVQQGSEAQQKHPIPHELVTMHTNIKSAHTEALMLHLLATGEWLGDGPPVRKAGLQHGAEKAPKQRLGASSMSWSAALLVLTNVPGYAWLLGDLDQVWCACHRAHAAPCCISRPPKGARH
jgi:hypothetical protein